MNTSRGISIRNLIASALVALAVSAVASPASVKGPTSRQRMATMSANIWSAQATANRAESVADEAQNTTKCVRGAIMLHANDDGTIRLATPADTDVIYALEAKSACATALNR